ncbi:hypothetical protein [Streptomyces sp. NPDC051001]|uniref:hypothetical protein n=1 Tax=Streptomyces sp. NPDC051001 TaxID=3155795 RepID=UPI00343A60F7
MEHRPYVIHRLPFQVEVIQTDNGAEFHGHPNLPDLIAHALAASFGEEAVPARRKV